MSLVMNKQGLPILLILMMLITPIASAFDHCAGIDMSGQLSESQNISVTQSVDGAQSLGHNTLKVLQNHQTDRDCHSSCTVHICGGDGIMSSIPTINTVTAPSYSIYEYVSPYDTPLSSDLKPPKQIF